MHRSERQLHHQIKRVRNHWKQLILVSGISKLMLIALILLAAGYALDTYFTLDERVRFIFLCLGAGAFVVVLFLTLVKPLLRVPTETRLARYLEEQHPQLEDRLVTAVELSSRQDPAVSPKLLEKLLEDTHHHIAPINLPKSLRSKGAMVWSVTTLAATLLFVALIMQNFENFGLHLNRLFSPWRYPNVKSRPELRVSPGNQRVQLGSSVEIRAELSAFSAEDVNLYYSHDNSEWTKVAMDATTDITLYTYHLFAVERDMRYYVKADDHLSDIYTFSVFDAPTVERVNLTLVYPTYTRLKTRHEIDTGDIWAPPGTVVHITAVASKGLRQGRMVLENGRELRSKIVSDTLLTASLTVRENSYYTVHLTGKDGLSNSPAPEYYIHAIPDQPPELTIERPGRDIKASMLEEVPITVSVRDDFSTPSVTLVYSVGGSEERHVKLQTRPVAEPENLDGLGQRRAFQADHLVYLEDLDVQPGDFLSYYLQATDANRDATEPASTDIYFIEVRPFEMIFSRPLSQQQGQAGGPDGLGGRLSQTQKEILIATWKLQNKQGKLPDGGFANNLATIIESQENLQDVTQSTLYQMQQRNMFTRESGADVVQYYENAVRAMSEALDALADKNLADAQTPEKQALQNLLRAEAQIKEVQMAQSQGAGDNASLDELAQLFEDEMDKLKNKYETLDKPSSRKQEKQVDDALKKIKELARRQQDFNRRMRELARQDATPEEKKRKIEALRREQENIRRQTQELSRQMQSDRALSTALPRDVQEQLRQASQEMNRASNNLKRNNADLAAAKGSQALSRLQKLQGLLKKTQQESLRRQLDEAQQQLHRVAEKQQQVTEDVQRLSETRQDISQELQAVKQRKAELKNELAQTESNLTALAGKAKNTRSPVRSQLQKLSESVKKSGLRDKIDRAERLLEDRKMRSALRTERQIQQQLNTLQDALTSLQSKLADSPEEKLDLALNQTQRLREQLESMQRQTTGRGGTAEPATGGKRQNTNGESQTVQAGPRESAQQPQTLDPAGMEWLTEQLARTKNNLDKIQQSVRGDSSLTSETRRIGDNIEGVLRTFAGGNPFDFDMLEDSVLLPLKGLEAEIAQKLELLRKRERLFLAREENVPPQYRDLVDKYYEAISKTPK